MDLSDLDITADSKERIIKTWKSMNEVDKGHFINQVALALSIWGSDKDGRVWVVEVLRFMAENDSNTLADFGLYIEQALKFEIRKSHGHKIKRAAVVIEGYRIKNALSSIPHRELGV